MPQLKKPRVADPESDLAARQLFRVARLRPGDDVCVRWIISTEEDDGDDGKDENEDSEPAQERDDENNEGGAIKYGDHGGVNEPSSSCPDDDKQLRPPADRAKGQRHEWWPGKLSLRPVLRQAATDQRPELDAASQFLIAHGRSRRGKTLMQELLEEAADDAELRNDKLLISCHGDAAVAAAAAASAGPCTTPVPSPFVSPKLMADSLEASKYQRTRDGMFVWTIHYEAREGFPAESCKAVFLSDTHVAHLDTGGEDETPVFFYHPPYTRETDALLRSIIDGQDRADVVTLQEIVAEQEVMDLEGGDELIPSCDVLLDQIYQSLDEELKRALCDRYQVFARRCKEFLQNLLAVKGQSYVVSIDDVKEFLTLMEQSHLQVLP